MKRKQIIFLTVEAGETGLSTRKMLLESAGFNVISAVSGTQALHFLEVLPINAVVFEPDVRDMPPSQFLRTAKQCRPQVPVYVLSAQPWIPDEFKPYTDGVIEKMSDPRQMVETFLQRFPSEAA